MRRALAILIVWLVVASELSASGGRCIRQTGYWGGDGHAEEAVVVNNHAFFGGVTLRVADLTDRAAPRVVHELRLDGAVTGLESNGDRVFAVNETEELTVIDASDPAAASIQARVGIGSGWRLHHIDIHGDLALVGALQQWSVPATTTNLTLLDVADPSTAPEPVGTLMVDGVVDTLALANRTAIAATYWGSIRFIDVSDPSAPFVALEVDALDLIISGRVHDLATFEDLLAISDSEGRVTLMDVSDPADPRYLSLIQGLGLGIADLEFDGTLLHAVGSTCTSSGVCGGYAVVNCFTPRNPNLLGRVDGPLMAGPAPYAGHVYAAAYKAGLRVIDLQWLNAPVILDAVLPERVAGALAFAGPLVHVVDVTSLAAPEDPDRNTLEVLERMPDGSLAEVGSYAPQGAIWALAGDGNFAAAAIYDEAIGFNSLEVIDVADPTTPVMGTRFGAVLSVESETMEPHLRAEGDRLYFSLEGSDDVLIYEVSEGGRATQVGEVRPDGELVNFAAPSDDVLMVAVRQGGTGWVNVVDIGDPSAPVVAARIDLPPPAEYAVSLDAEGDLLSILSLANDGWEGPYHYATLVDISDPTSPLVLADKLPATRWVAMGAADLHGVVDVWFPPRIQHVVLDLADPSGLTESENLGSLDVFRNRVDARDSTFAVSRGRLEVHRYGICRPPVAPTVHPAVAE
ncbi:MAG: hypothetical protein AB1Z65_05630 [Candidatus Sulfomarinibacteraceae bacterium]